MHIIIILAVFLYILFNLTNHGFIYRHPTTLLSIGIFLCFIAFMLYRLIGILEPSQINTIDLGGFTINKDELNALVGLTIGSVSAAFITSSLMMRLQRSHNKEKDQLFNEKKKLVEEKSNLDEALLELNLSELKIPVEINLNMVPYLDKKGEINSDFFQYDDACRMLIIKNHIQKELDRLNDRIIKYQ